MVTVPGAGEHSAVDAFQEQCLRETEANSHAILEALKSVVCPADSGVLPPPPPPAVNTFAPSPAPAPSGDPCDANPCENGGGCSSDAMYPGKAFCMCLTGYNGELCEEDSEGGAQGGEHQESPPPAPAAGPSPPPPPCCTQECRDSGTASPECCSELQTAVLDRCLSNCETCATESIKIVLGDCRVELWSSPAGDNVCAHVPGPSPPSPPCCTQECRDSGTASPECCSELQTAVMTECRRDCTKCQTDKVRIILGECLLENGSPAHDNLSCGIMPPPARTVGMCSPLQEAVIRSCLNDCANCNTEDIHIVLASCEIDGVAQVMGETFCIQGDPCTDLQHGVLARCLSNCATCNKDATNVVVTDCVVNSGTHQRSGASEMIATQCDTGAPCTGLQQAILARCMQNCAACDRLKTGTVLGSCVMALDDQGAAVSLLDHTCDSAMISTCSEVQADVTQDCVADCSQCDMADALNAVRGCTLMTGVIASVAIVNGCAVNQGAPASPPPPGPCTSTQQAVIRSCSGDCAGCNMDNVQTALGDCLNSDGTAAMPGITFCIRGASCSQLQHAVMIRCMANCAVCKIEETQAVLTDCMADMDRVNGGTRAVELIETTCAMGSPCSGLQQAIAARCMQNCLACDQRTTGTVLGACTETDGDAAIELIDTVCSAAPLPPDPEPTGIPQPPPPPRLPPPCTMLQSAIMDECHRDCDKCAVDKVRIIIGECVLENRSPAKSNMCTQVDLPSAHLGECSPLQQAVIRSCSNDCGGCDASSVSIVLGGCIVDGVAQAAGTIFCVKGRPCSELQMVVLAHCLSNCDVCIAKEAETLTVLGDCVADDDVVYGGTRAAELVAIGCDTGVSCSALQSAVVAHCLKDCSICDSRKTGTVLGACTMSGGESAVSMISEECRAADETRPPPPPMDGHVMDGYIPPSCSMLQTTVMAECERDCSACTVDRVTIILGDCLIPAGTAAQNQLACAQAAGPPPPAGPAGCTALQQAVITHCTTDCLTCNMHDVQTVLGGCVLSDDSGTQQAIPGTTFCVREGTKCSELQHGVLARCLSNCEHCNTKATNTVLADCRADMDKVWNGVVASDLVDTECTESVPCTEIQQTVFARCAQNCDACDKANTGIVLGMCTEELPSGGHGTAVGYIESHCSIHDLPGSSTGIDVIAIAGLDEAPQPPMCTMLQSAIMTECHRDCNACKVDKVRIIIADCMLENGTPAHDNMCTQVALSPSLTPGVCNRLQQAVSEQCAKDCTGCDQYNVNVVLNQCTLNGVAQLAGAAFCIQGSPCSTVQYSILVRCLSNCDQCNKGATDIVLGDCVSNHDVVFGGTRATELVATECDTGAPCSPLQSAVLTHCVSNCVSCDTRRTGTLLGACTVEEHGSAVSMISETCSAPSSAATTSLIPPPPPPSCSMLQTAVMNECHKDCTNCNVGSVRIIIGDCVLENGSQARDNMCMQVSLPPPAVQGGCSELQKGLIDHCEDACENCDSSSVGIVLAGCTVDGKLQEKGATFCTLNGGQADQSVSIATDAVSAQVVETKFDSIQGYSTYELTLDVNEAAARNVYKIYGTPTNPLNMPAAYQVVEPYGTNVGGTDPELWPENQEAQYDSWLSVGITDGDLQSAIGAIGIDFTSWNTVTSLQSAAGEVGYLADPTKAPDDAATVVVAQVTVPTATAFVATVNVEGFARAGSQQAKWQQEDVRFDSR